MISLLEIAQNMNEADDDKYVSIGFGRFKLKGKEDDDDADVYAKTDSGKYVKSADQKSDDDGGKKPEEPQGGKLGGSDFDRDGDDREEDPNYLFKQDDDDEDENNVADANDDVIRSLEDMDLNGLDINSVSSETDEGMYAELMGKDVDEPDNAMTVTAFEENGKIDYGINVGIGHDVIYFDTKEEALKATQKLAKDDKIRKAMDGEGEETLADLGNHAKSIVKGKDETIKVIDGKKYKAIKESKKNPRILKEIYDRTFRSLK
tara:strand:+ start:397 stop:1182 length:786 start_codon:yes stop_codon:yes gene_type:complete